MQARRQPAKELVGVEELDAAVALLHHDGDLFDLLVGREALTAGGAFPTAPDGFLASVSRESTTRLSGEPQ